MNKLMNFLPKTTKYEVCSKNTRTVWIARLELVSGESAWCRQVRTDQLIKTPFSGRRYLHLLISYTVLNKECFFHLSDCKMNSLKEQRIAVKFCLKLGNLKHLSCSTRLTLMLPWNVLHVSSGMNVSRVPDSRLTAMSVMGVFNVNWRPTRWQNQHPGARKSTSDH